jgi:tRNA threonylcarbamoyladenosine biosynthesis protein TsaE
MRAFWLGLGRTGFSLSAFEFGAAGIAHAQQSCASGQKPDRLKPVLLKAYDRTCEMTAKEFITHSSEETIAKGREIASKLQPPVLVLLKGDLGSGKTTLTKGIISGLGAAREEDVTSPTFNLVHEFRKQIVPGSEENSQSCKVYHVDLYRIENFHDLESLGLEDALSEKAIVIIEWPEHFTLRTDWPIVEIRLNHAGGDSRRIAISDLHL